ncbi:SHOCT domain-containing protein [Methanobrevibacter sp. DSM 116169]|uniref:SHOCT domain-containing protein n=1 Tax=Methanobrevibacter sp. DSM 116169 TaxID=3242727 RepID=UPI0038FCBAD2
MGLFGSDSPEDEKIKELVGGFTYSKTLEKKLTQSNLVPVSDFFVEIQNDFKNGVKENNISIGEMEDYLDKIILDKTNNLSDKEREKVEENATPEGAKYIFECNIHEGRTNITGDREKDLVSGVVTLYDEYLEIEKKSFWLGRDRGGRKVLYTDITSIDHDKAGFLSWNHGVEITISGSEVLVLESVDGDKTEDFYQILADTVHENKLAKNKPQEVKTEASAADELSKLFDLYQSGALSEEEFNLMKKKLLE